MKFNSCSYIKIHGALLFSVFFATSFASETNILDETPSIIQTREEIKQQVTNFDFFVNYQPTTLLERLYSKVDNLPGFTRGDYFALWVIFIYVIALRSISSELNLSPNIINALLLSAPVFVAKIIDSSSQLYRYKTHRALTSGLKRLEAAEYLLDKSCPAVLHKRACSQEDKDHFFTSYPLSSLGSTWYTLSSVGEFLGLSSFINFFSLSFVTYTAVNVAKEMVTRKPNPIPRALLKFSVGTLTSLVGQYTLVQLFEKINEADNNSLYLAKARSHLKNAQQNFQTALRESANYKEAFTDTEKI